MSTSLEGNRPKGDIISIFDIPLVQPNEDLPDSRPAPAIEHLLAMLIRKHIDGMMTARPLAAELVFFL